MKNRAQILAEIFKEKEPPFEISVLTDEELDDLEQIMKRDGLHFISIEKAVQNGFIVPDDPDEVINQLIKFYTK